MPKIDYETLQRAAKTAALEGMFAWQVNVIPGILLGVSSSEIRSQLLSVLRSKLSAIRHETPWVAFPELPPEQSDLWAAEIQEAYEVLIARVEQALDQLHPSE